MRIRYKRTKCLRLSELHLSILRLPVIIKKTRGEISWTIRSAYKKLPLPGRMGRRPGKKLKTSTLTPAKRWTQCILSGLVWSLEFQVLHGKARSQCAASKISVQYCYSSRAKQRNVDEKQFPWVHKGGNPCDWCLCWGIFRCEGFAAPAKSHKIYWMQGIFEMRG